MYTRVLQFAAGEPEDEESPVEDNANESDEAEDLVC